MEAKGKNAKNKPFKLTRELIRLALNDGWTQQEIAGKCRTQQSVVSAWKAGSKYASEQQLKPLLEIYGHKLRRKAFRVYWSRDEESQSNTFYRIEGTIILDKVFYYAKQSSAKKIKRQPFFRLVVHSQGNNKFVIVIQDRYSPAFTNEDWYSLDECFWSSSILKPMTLDQMISEVEMRADWMTEHQGESMNIF